MLGDLPLASNNGEHLASEDGIPIVRHDDIAVHRS